MNRYTLSTALLATMMIFGGGALAQDYDVVILNGRVMDPETEFDSVANVGVKGGTIAVITTDDIAGKDSIDATGHVVAPGFIDTHVHIIDQPIGQKLMLRDGVTTPLDLEVGAYPVERFYDYMNGKSQTNYGATVSALGAREEPDAAHDGSIEDDLPAGPVS